MKSLVEQMSFYAAYHHNPVNKAIHFVFVPAIVWSAMGLLSFPIPQPWTSLAVTPALVLAALLLTYYLRLDFVLGIAMVALFTVFLVTAYDVRANLGMFTLAAWLVPGAIFALSWVAQIVGHLRFEHRKPALTDDVWQVFVAPIFVVAEWAFALGLKPQLRAAVETGMKDHLA
jgi:uncharacterized membrane protein YGL010W